MRRLGTGSKRVNKIVSDQKRSKEIGRVMWPKVTRETRLTWIGWGGEPLRGGDLKGEKELST